MVINDESMKYGLDVEKWQPAALKTDVVRAGTSPLAGGSLFHTSPRQAPFTRTSTEAVQFKMEAPGQNTGVVTRVAGHCSPLVTPPYHLQYHTTTLSTIFHIGGERDREQGQGERSSEIR